MPSTYLWTSENSISNIKAGIEAESSLKTKETAVVLGYVYE